MRGNLWPTGRVTTRNVATPGNVAKKALPENVANFVGEDECGLLTVGGVSG